MTHQAAFEQTFERTAQSLREESEAQGSRADRIRLLKAANAHEALAGMFAAGDYDADLMAKYSAMASDAETEAAVVNAGTMTLLKVGFEPGFDHPDDVLDTILREAAHLV